MPLLLRGEPARANGWLARARRLLDEHGLDCVERGYLLVPVGLQRIHGLVQVELADAPEQRARLGTGAEHHDGRGGGLGRIASVAAPGVTALGIVAAASETRLRLAFGFLVV